MHKYQPINFFSNVVKSIRPTYGNKEELAALKLEGLSYVVGVCFWVRMGDWATPAVVDQPLNYKCMSIPSPSFPGRDRHLEPGL